jgi:hypothetical protein
MKTRSLVTVSCLAVVSLISFVVSAAQDTKESDVVKHGSPVDEMLKELATAISELDTKRAKALFLPPDETPDGKNREGHLREMEKDWKRAKERKEKITVAFKNTVSTTENTVTTVRTEMFVGGDEAEAEPMPVEFRVVITKEGCRIVAMNYLKE